jgi:hypothetical protein
MILSFTRLSATLQIQLTNIPKSYTLKLDAAPAVIESGTLTIAGYTMAVAPAGGALTAVLPFHIMSGTGTCTLQFAARSRKLGVLAIVYP